MGHGHNNPNRARREFAKEMAEEAGRKAKLDGKPRESNPYDQRIDPQRWQGWDRGWWQSDRA